MSERTRGRQHENGELQAAPDAQLAPLSDEQVRELIQRGVVDRSAYLKPYDLRLATEALREMFPAAFLEQDGQ